MKIKEIQAKRMLIYNKNPAGWFGVKYYFNIYRGCMHRCIYCDSRSECYDIDHFDKEIHVKVNAIQLLRKELAKKRYKETIGFGATSDPYIPIEVKYELTKQALELIYEQRFPLFILTKSNLVLRDIDIIERINKQNYACVAFTITTTDDELAKVIEPNSPAPSERLKALKILSSLGIKTGVVIMPILPFLTDSIENIENIVFQAKESGADFVYASFATTLRDRQRDFFYSQLDDSIVELYKKRYKDYYLCAVPNYKKLKGAFHKACKKYDISSKMMTYEKLDLYNQLPFLNKR